MKPDPFKDGFLKDRVLLSIMGKIQSIIHVTLSPQKIISTCSISNQDKRGNYLVNYVWPLPWEGRQGQHFHPEKCGTLTAKVTWHLSIWCSGIWQPILAFCVRNFPSSTNISVKCEFLGKVRNFQLSMNISAKYEFFGKVWNSYFTEIFILFDFRTLPKNS